MIYEYINPSDPYTFEADNDAVASFSAWLVSQSCGAARVDPEGCGCYGAGLFGIPDQFIADHGSTDDFLAANTGAIARALQSFVLGSVGDRRTFDRMRAELDDAAFAAFSDVWDDERRSSLSEHGKRAHQIGAALAVRATA